MRDDGALSSARTRSRGARGLLRLGANARGARPSATRRCEGGGGGGASSASVRSVRERGAPPFEARCGHLGCYSCWLELLGEAKRAGPGGRARRRELSPARAQAPAHQGVLHVSERAGRGGEGRVGDRKRGWWGEGVRAGGGVRARGEGTRGEAASLERRARRAVASGRPEHVGTNKHQVGFEKEKPVGKNRPRLTSAHMTSTRRDRRSFSGSDVPAKTIVARDDVSDACQPPRCDARRDRLVGDRARHRGRARRRPRARRAVVRAKERRAPRIGSSRRTRRTALNAPSLPVALEAA